MKKKRSSSALLPLLLLLLLAPSGLSGEGGLDDDDDDDGGAKPEKPKLEFSRISVTAPAHRVFRFAFNPRLFRWEAGNAGGGDRRPTYDYLPMREGSAGLPQWIKYKYSDRHKAGFLYGVPGDPGASYRLDVVATNKVTYEVGLLKLTINITETENGRADLAVQLKIDNLNLEDMFDSHRLKNLKSLFRHRLWPQSEPDLHLVHISSSPDAGHRRPVVPSMKDGVVLSLGSAEAGAFSGELRSLDDETRPLRGRPGACPRDYKRTSVERHFRAKGFALDWCEFRLATLDEDDGVFRELGYVKPNVTEDEAPTPPPAVVPLPDFLGPNGEVYDSQGRMVFNGTLPKMGDLPERDFTRQYAFIFGVTAAVGAVLFTLVGLVFCYPCCECCASASTSASSEVGRARAEKEREGFNESLFLVLRDCVTCCRVREKEQKSGHVRADDDFHRSAASSAAAASSDPRYRRATSVQRQTDTLRRLAQRRDVTPRLQSPLPGTVPTYVPTAGAAADHSDGVNVTSNYDYDDDLDDMANSEVGGPVILLSDDGGGGGIGGGYSRESSPGLMYRGGGSRHGTVNRPTSRFESDPLGSLPRPVPPPYYEAGRGFAEDEAEKAYLV